jgi:hypothetical protein
MRDSLQLPSKGKVYQVPLESITVRSLKGGDEKLLSDLTLDNLEKKYLLLLKNRIKNGLPVVSGIEPEKLTLGDRLYILLWLRIQSYSAIFKAELVCQYCFEKIKVDIDLQKIEEKTLDENFKEPYEIVLKDGSKVNLRLFRIEDEIKVAEREKKDGTEKTYLYKLALSIVDDKSIPERIDYLENLDVKDLSLIKKFHEDFDHGPKINEVAYDCPKCKEAGQLALPFRPQFLIPSGSEIN